MGVGATRRGFVGRERELGLLAEALAATDGGHGQVVMVTGEAGIGKTRLVQEALARSSLAASWGRCWESGGAPAYWPWIQALSAALGAGDGGEAIGRLAPHDRETLAALLPELANADRDAPPYPRGSPPGDAEAARFGIFRSVAALLRQLCRGQGRVVVLEDLHAADLSSLLLLRFLATELGTLGLSVIGTWRDTDPRLTDPLRQALARVSAGALVLSLPMLERTDVRTLVLRARAGSAGQASDLEPWIDAIARATGGNPLFVEGVLRGMSDAPHASPTALRIPAALQDIVRQQLEPLDPAARAVVEVAAVIGHDTSVGLVAAAMGVEPVHVAEPLERAAAMGILLAVEHQRLAFAHGLVRETLYRDLSPLARATGHRAVARALAQAMPLEGTEAPWAQLAHHFLEAGSECFDDAVAHAVRAADAALDALAFEDAIALLERVRERVTLGGADPRLRAELLLAEGSARVRADEGARGTRLCAQAAELARRLGDHELLARAALAYGSEFTFGRTDKVLVRLLEEALARLPPASTALRASLMARLAAALQPAADPREPVRLAREAIAMAADHPDDRVRLAVIHTAMSALVDFVHAGERIGLNLEAERLATALGDLPRLLRARARLVFDHVELGALDACEAAAAGYRELVLALPSARWSWSLPLVSGMRAALAGCFDEAEAALAEAERASVSLADDTSGWVLAMHRLCLYRTMERPAGLNALEPRFRPALGAIPTATSWDTLLRAAIQVRTGDLERARASLGECDLELMMRQADNVCAGLLAEVVALTGQGALAERLYPLLLPLAGKLMSYGMIGIACEGPYDRQLALLADAAGRHQHADRHFADAVAICARLELRPHLARLRYEHARSLRARDPAASGRLLREAHAGADALGLVGLVPLIEALLADAHVPAAETPTPELLPPRPITLERSGDFWTLRAGSRVLRLKDMRGLRILERLVANPERELHVCELVADPGQPLPAGDAGEMLDPRARERYRARTAELEETVAEAEAFGDYERASRAREELAVIAAELARAVGLGGRGRRAGSAAERARVTVQKRLKDALRRIAELAPDVAAQLNAAIRTGSFCEYRPGGFPV